MLTPVSIQDLEAGKVDIESLLQQIEFLQGKLEKIRYDMFIFINAMSSMDETSTPSEVYKDILSKVTNLKTEFNTFFNAYKCVLPVIRYFKIKQGMSPDDSIKIIPHRVQIDTKLLNDIKSSTNDLDMVVSAAISTVSTPINNIQVNSNSANTTPSNKKSQSKTTKRKNSKKSS